MTFSDWKQLHKNYKNKCEKIKDSIRIHAVVGTAYNQLFHLTDYTVVAHFGATVYIRGKEKTDK